MTASGHDGEEEHGDRHSVLDGSRGDPGDRIRLRRRHLESR